jgi:hypothetical protein
MNAREKGSIPSRSVSLQSRPTIPFVFFFLCSAHFLVAVGAEHSLAARFFSFHDPFVFARGGRRPLGQGKSGQRRDHQHGSANATMPGA